MDRATLTCAHRAAGGRMSSRRCRRVFLLLPVVLVSAAPLGGQNISLERYAPPQGTRFHVPASGLVTLSVSGADVAPEERVSLSLLAFRSASARVRVTFDSAMSPASATSATIRAGDPVILNAAAMPVGSVAWGHLRVGDELVPVILERGAPPLVLADGDAPTIVDAGGLGTLRLNLDGYLAAGSEATLSLTPFWASDGVYSARVPIWPRPPEGCGSEEPESSEGSSGGGVKVPLDATEVSLCIQARGLPIGVDYEGALVTTIGDTEFPPVPVVLRREGWSRTATLAAPGARTATGTCRILFVGCRPADVRVVLTPDQAEVPVVGVAARNLSAVTADFDPTTDLELRLVRSGPDSLSGSLWRLDASDAQEVQRRSIQPGEQAELLITFAGRIPPGQHSAKIQLTALNGDPAQSRELALSVAIRYWAGYPFLVLVLSVLVSFLATKGVVAMRAHRGLANRIKAILREEPFQPGRWATLPAIRAHATVALADAMRRQEWGPVKSIVVPQRQVERLDAVANTLPTLVRLNRLADFWGLLDRDGPDADGMILRRAQKVLRSIVTTLERDPDADVSGALADLEAWPQRSADYKEPYWEDLKKDITALQGKIGVDRFDLPEAPLASLGTELEALVTAAQAVADQPAVTELGKAEAAFGEIRTAGSGPVRQSLEAARAATSKLSAEAFLRCDEALAQVEASDREVIRTLLSRLDPTREPLTVREAVEQEEVYARLKLIWEQLGDPDMMDRLLGLARRGQPVEVFFETVDVSSWEKLQASPVDPEAPGLVIERLPRGMDAPVEAYDLVSFQVRPLNSGANSYLFKHGLRYDWSLAYGDGRTLTPSTRGPRVVQFIPTAADVTVSVTVTWEDPPHKSSPIVCTSPPSEKVTTTERARVGFLTAYRVPEVAATVIALLLAVASGLQTEAFQHALAGSFKDFGVLFAWGIGADQVKNLLANVAAYSPSE